MFDTRGMQPDAETPRFDDLTPEEVRVLGCLIEKEATVPDSYPLTLNSLRTACNQSTSRHPVVDYDDHQVTRALAALRERGLTRTVHSTSNRATKYRHVVPDALGLDPGETAVLAVLMLRGPQTVGELKSRSERLHAFDSIDDVGAVLDALAGRPAPLAMRLERRPGQKDARWIHLLTPSASVLGDSSVSGDGAMSEPARAVADVDPYAATAEFHDLLASAHWERRAVELSVLLADVDPSSGPVVDIGAGTGVELGHILSAVPGAAIFAIEPSRSMRVGLHTRLALDAQLRDAVTVDPRRLGDASLPATASALVMTAVVGLLTDDERTGVWRYVADRMAPGSPAIVEVPSPWRPVEIEPTRFGAVRVGGHTYEGWYSCTPIGEDELRRRTVYKVLDDDGAIAEHVVETRWRCVSPDDLRDEVAPLGLTVTEYDELVVIGA
jgi:uncharacterized protein YceH (UPF0502 family)